jgi:hypothetical protein
MCTTSNLRLLESDAARRWRVMKEPAPKSRSPSTDARNNDLLIVFISGILLDTACEKASLADTRVC